MVKGRKSRINHITGRDTLLLTVLALLLFLVASPSSTGYFFAVSSLNDKLFENEVWVVDSCSFDTADSVAFELQWTFGCDVDYCRDAAYGVELPRGIVVELSCMSSDQRSQWVQICSEAFERVC